ncbi:MAG: hypothetical protein ACJ788_26065 [Ktedonobacteraceae bacterium]
MNIRKGLPIIWLFLSGSILGTALDAWFVYSGIERYPSHVLFGMAWWVPLLFGGAAVAIAYSHTLVDPLLRHRRRRPHPFITSGELLWLVLAYTIGVSILNTFAKVGLLLVIYLNFWVIEGRGWQNLLLSLTTAITGTLIEMILVAAGMFSYLHPDFIGVPYWLPCIYLCASLAVGDFGRSLLIFPREVTHETF